MAEDIRIPNRFESLHEVFGDQIRPLIVSIPEDLKKLNALRDRARVQNGGLLSFLLGPTGVGKTTAVHSAAVHMPEIFAPVTLIPPEISLRDVNTWLPGNLPEKVGSKASLVLFDGREISDDDVGVRQLLSTLNQLLRRRPDILFCWPTTDSDWHHHIRGIAEQIGGSNFAPPESDCQIAGPPPGEWPVVFERLLLQFGKTCEDVGVARDFLGQCCAGAKTLGDFLTSIGRVVAERVTQTREIRQLPQLLFVITS